MKSRELTIFFTARIVFGFLLSFRRMSSGTYVHFCGILFRFHSVSARAFRKRPFFVHYARIKFGLHLSMSIPPDVIRHVCPFPRNSIPLSTLCIFVASMSVKIIRNSKTAFREGLNSLIRVRVCTRVSKILTTKSKSLWK